MAWEGSSEAASCTHPACLNPDCFLRKSGRAAPREATLAAKRGASSQLGAPAHPTPADDWRPVPESWGAAGAFPRLDYLIMPSNRLNGGRALLRVAEALPRHAPACKLATCLNEGCLAALQAGLLVGSQARRGRGHCRLHTCRPSSCSTCRHPASQPARRLIHVSGYATQFVLPA